MGVSTLSLAEEGETSNSQPIILSEGIIGRPHLYVSLCYEAMGWVLLSTLAEWKPTTMLLRRLAFGRFLSTITTIISTSTAGSQVLFFVIHYPHHSSTIIIVRHYQVVGDILSKSLFTSNIRIYLDDCPYITLQITSSAVRHSLRHHPNICLAFFLGAPISGTPLPREEASADESFFFCFMHTPPFLATLFLYIHQRRIFWFSHLA